MNGSACTVPVPYIAMAARSAVRVQLYGNSTTSTEFSEFRICMRACMTAILPVPYIASLLTGRSTMYILHMYCSMYVSEKGVWDGMRPRPAWPAGARRRAMQQGEEHQAQTKRPKMSISMATHSGTFQCDEALGIWMLRQLPKWKLSLIHI